MNVYQLSKRLEKVAEFLPNHAKFADIGSDHAYLPCYVCLRDPYAQAIAGEVNQGPYDSAKQEVKAQELQDRIEVRLGDGLEILKSDEVDQIVIAGMGGPLIRDILERGKDKLTSVKRIIVQPNIGAKSLRKWFFEHDFKLVEETILEENNHIYEVLTAEPGDPHEGYHQEELAKEMWLGPRLLEQRTAVFKEYCKVERMKKEKVLNQLKQANEPQLEKVNNLTQEINWLKEVLDS